jgi:NAD-dependent deacetylase
MPAAKLPDLALAVGAVVIHLNTIDVAMGEPNELMLIGQAGQVMPRLVGLAVVG